MKTIAILFFNLATIGICYSQCPNIGGTFWRSSDALFMAITRNSCSISAAFDNYYVKHTLSGNWNPSIGAYNVTILRHVIPTGCDNILYGTISTEGQNIRLTITSTNGACSMSPTYGESTIWSNLGSDTSPRLIAAEINFNTTNDDKDWDTKPFVDVNLDGRTIATLDCCSSDKSGDHWGGGVVTKPLIIKEYALATLLLSRGTCTLGAQAGSHGQGNDTWKFDASLKLTFSYGAPVYFGGNGWNGIEFYSYSKSHESTQPPIPLYHPYAPPKSTPPTSNPSPSGFKCFITVAFGDKCNSLYDNVYLTNSDRSNGHSVTIEINERGKGSTQQVIKMSPGGKQVIGCSGGMMGNGETREFTFKVVGEQ